MNIKNDLDTISSWQQQLKEAIRSKDVLADVCNVTLSDTQELDFSLFATAEYVAKIKKNDLKDPLLLQIIKPKITSDIIFTDVDVVGDLPALKQKSLIHKYKGRVLLLLTSACPVHCQYCFRQHFPYAKAGLFTRHKEQAIDYIQNNPQITEIILSGGDPLMLSNAQLSELFSSLEVIEHIKTIRIHSRMVSMLTARFDDELYAILGATSKNVVFVNHINHAQELNAATKVTFLRLRECACILLNQTVLLKGINDNVTALKNLSENMFAQGVLPYYLHQLDEVQGAEAYFVDRIEGLFLIKELQKQVAGYLVPKFVEEIAGAASKQFVL